MLGREAWRLLQSLLPEKHFFFFKSILYFGVFLKIKNNLKNLETTVHFRNGETESFREAVSCVWVRRALMTGPGRGSKALVQQGCSVSGRHALGTRKALCYWHWAGRPCMLLWDIAVPQGLLSPWRRCKKETTAPQRATGPASPVRRRSGYIEPPGGPWAPASRLRPTPT